MAFINVIIPVYNAEKYLEETVNSVLSQPYKDIEIVLVNDGSTDSSPEICDKIAENEKRVTVIHQKNGGASSARNKGIEFVLGGETHDGYIAFLDADDLWYKEVITDDLAKRIETANADVVGFSMYSSNENADKLRIMNEYTNQILEYSTNNQVTFLWAGGSFAAHFYKKELFSNTRIVFDVYCKQNEDVIFSAKMLYSSRKIILLNEFLYVYRTNYNSITHTAKYNSENATDIPDSWEVAKSAFDNSNIEDEILSKWKYFCSSTSSIRCLEMIRELALYGYSFKEIDEVFKNKEYYKNIANLSESELAYWQRSDLKMYKNSNINFCNYYKRKRFFNKVKKKLLSFSAILKIIDNYKYTINYEKNK